MRTCRNKFGATEKEISEAFNRDVRQVRRHLKKLEAKLDLEPVQVRAMGEHLQEVSHLLEGWEDKIKLSIDLLPKRVGFNYEAEEKTLFSGLLEHCPSVAKKYEALKETRDIYGQAQGNLESQIAGYLFFAPVNKAERESSSEFKKQLKLDILELLFARQDWKK